MNKPTDLNDFKIDLLDSGFTADTVIGYFINPIATATATLLNSDYLFMIEVGLN